MINLKKIILTFIALSSYLLIFSQSKLIQNIEAGQDQVVVVYGTSLSTGSNGRSWMNELVRLLNDNYTGRIKYHLAGKGGRWSTWGVQNIEDSVVLKKPDVVFIEFGINDASYLNGTSLEFTELNLQYMINRIKLYNPDCEIILQVMNMAIGKSGSFRPNLDEYYDIYRKLAQKENLLLIDHYPNWLNILNKGEDYFLEFVPDGLHPNKNASVNIIAPYIYKRLKEGK